MDNIKYQVFVSSTYEDLKNERMNVINVLLHANCIPVGMEFFVATDEEQFKIIKSIIDLCDYYVLILGKKYGSVNSATGLSYTEMEYNYAIEIGIPVLVFCIDDNVKLDENKVEHDPLKKEKLAQFKNKAMKNRLGSIWKDEGELEYKLAVAIKDIQNTKKRPGWHRVSISDNNINFEDILCTDKKKLSCEEKLGDIYTKSTMEDRYLEFIKNSKRVYILVKDLDFLAEQKLVSEKIKIKSMGEKCRIIFMKKNSYDNDINKLLIELKNANVGLKTYQHNESDICNIKGQFIIDNYENYDCLVIGYPEPGIGEDKFKLFNMKNSFLCKALWNMVEEFYESDNTEDIQIYS